VLRDRALTPEQIEQAAKNGSLEGLILHPGPDLVEIARGIGLEMSAFEADRNGAWCQAFLARDHDELERLDLEMLPTFYLGTRRSNAGSKEELRSMRFWWRRRSPVAGGGRAGRRPMTTGPT
jgi:hypothetical protein